MSFWCWSRAPQILSFPTTALMNPSVATTSSVPPERPFLPTSFGSLAKRSRLPWLSTRNILAAVELLRSCGCRCAMSMLPIQAAEKPTTMSFSMKDLPLEPSPYWLRQKR